MIQPRFNHALCNKERGLELGFGDPEDSVLDALPDLTLANILRAMLSGEELDMVFLLDSEAVPFSLVGPKSSRDARGEPSVDERGLNADRENRAERCFSSAKATGSGRPVLKLKNSW